MKEIREKNDNKFKSLGISIIFFVAIIVIGLGLGAIGFSSIYNEMNLADKAISGSSSRPWEIPLQVPVKLIYEIGRPLIPVSIVLIITGTFLYAKKNPVIMIPLTILGIICIFALIFS